MFSLIWVCLNRCMSKHRMLTAECVQRRQKSQPALSHSYSVLVQSYIAGSSHLGLATSVAQLCLIPRLHTVAPSPPTSPAPSLATGGGMGLPAPWPRHRLAEAVCSSCILQDSGLRCVTDLHDVVDPLLFSQVYVPGHDLGYRAGRGWGRYGRDWY